jgi:hypothetical protein
MHRIDADGHVSNEFDDGDPGIPTQPTMVDAAWLNAVQEEIANVVEDAGITLVKNTNTQLREAIRFFMQGVEPGGRLALGGVVSGSNTTDPLLELDGATIGHDSISYVPYKHNRLALYNGTDWVPHFFTAMNQVVTDATKSPAAGAANSTYDMFVWNDSGTLRCTRGPAWSTDTTRGTGAGTTELERVDGRYVNKIAITNGPAAQRGLYVGTVRTDSTTKFWDGRYDVFAQKRFIWNMYNRVPRSFIADDATNNWNYNTNAFRQARDVGGGSDNYVEIVRGLDEDAVSVTVSVLVANSGGAVSALAGVGLDSKTALATNFVSHGGGTHVANVQSMVGGSWVGLPGLGFHTLYWLENGRGAGGTTAWYGDNGEGTAFNSGLFGSGLF